MSASDANCIQMECMEMYITNRIVDCQYCVCLVISHSTGGYTRFQCTSVYGQTVDNIQISNEI